jgi:opacity protein-like surface antigen
MYKFMFMITTVALLVSQATFAAQPTRLKNDTKKVYVGLQLGYADMHYGKHWLMDGEVITSIGDVKHQGVAGRLYAGYNFNQYLATEVGVLWFPKVEFNNITCFEESGLNESFRQTAVDFFLKGTAPLSEKLDVFGKGGFATFIRNDLKVEYQGGTLEGDAEGRTTVAGLGVGTQYHLTSNVLIDASYTRYLKRSDLPATDFLGLGIVCQF